MNTGRPFQRGQEVHGEYMHSLLTSSSKLDDEVLACEQEQTRRHSGNGPVAQNGQPEEYIHSTSCSSEKKESSTPCLACSTNPCSGS